MKYFLIGEDIDRKEISEEAVETFSQEDDYRVIRIPDESEYSCDAPQEKEPDWVPFEFPEKPGYVLSGIRIVRSDPAGEFSPQVVYSIPEDAVKTAIPNTWRCEYGTGYDVYEAYPVYEILQTKACGGCSGCARLSCKRREDGNRCRNYRKEEPNK